jgi:hypothetical protein
LLQSEGQSTSYSVIKIEPPFPQYSKRVSTSQSKQYPQIQQ